MSDNFDFASFLTDFLNGKQPLEKECCNTCGHSKEEGKCELFKVSKPYPNDDKCWLYVKRKKEK